VSGYVVKVAIRLLRSGTHIGEARKERTVIDVGNLLTGDPDRTEALGALHGHPEAAEEASTCVPVLVVEHAMERAPVGLNGLPVPVEADDAVVVAEDGDGCSREPRID